MVVQLLLLVEVGPAVKAMAAEVALALLLLVLRLSPTLAACWSIWQSAWPIVLEQGSPVGGVFALQQQLPA